MNLLDEDTLILKGEIVEVKYKLLVEGTEVKKTLQLRRIACFAQKHETVFVYWTNNLILAAMQVVEIYAYRQIIEIFF